MMRKNSFKLGIAALFLLGAVAARAEGLRVSPITLEWTAPGTTTMLNLENSSERPVNVQLRVFRWTQKNGVEQLTPTSDVVASPPITQLAPNVLYSVRVVRVNKTPVVAEESYRVAVDEIPDRSLQRAGAVSFVVRHSIPIFVRSLNASLAKPSWSLQRVADTPENNSVNKPGNNASGNYLLIAQNTGDGRLRLADVTLSQKGQRLGGLGGLVGYVLGKNTMQWPITLTPPPASGPVELSAQTQMGQIDASITVQDR